jgi:NADH-quinone oxidoreductase subunit F
MGINMREVLEEWAGGPSRNYAWKAVIPGGLSTPLLTPDQFDVALDFDSVAKAGSRLGTAGLIVLDEGDDIVEATEAIMRFYARESCGFCTPCREGIPWIHEIVRAIAEGRGQWEDMEVLDDMCRQIGHTFCAFAPGAQGPLMSALQKFRHEFEAKLPKRAVPQAEPEPEAELAGTGA